MAGSTAAASCQSLIQSNSAKMVCMVFQVQALRVEKTRLVVDPERGTRAVGTGEYEEYPVQLVLKSIGYKSLPLSEVPFDSKTGTVPNIAGRVLTGDFFKQLIGCTEHANFLHSDIICPFSQHAHQLGLQ